MAQPEMQLFNSNNISTIQTCLCAVLERVDDRSTGDAWLYSPMMEEPEETNKVTNVEEVETTMDVKVHEFMVGVAQRNQELGRS